MDILEFRQLMRDKYAEKEKRQWQRLRSMRIWILCNAALVGFLFSFVLSYLRAAGK